jgi:hypothetical protein
LARFPITGGTACHPLFDQELNRESANGRKPTLACQHPPLNSKAKVVPVNFAPDDPTGRARFWKKIARYRLPITNL